MHKRIIYLFIVVCLANITACKKGDNGQATTQTIAQKNELLNFAVNGQLYNAFIIPATKNILVVVPHTLNKSALTFSFTLSDLAKANINNTALLSGANIVNCTLPVTLTITSGDKTLTTNWTITVQNDYEYNGLGGAVAAEKSQNKFYDYYIDQWDASIYQAINCGPTVTTMAIKWADSAFTGTPVIARNLIRPTGGWWYTTDIQYYLNLNGINNATIALPNTDALIKQLIDKGNLVILCLDMFYVNYNANTSEHTDKFYVTTAKDWGHFLLVKGYKQIDGKFYLEIYDPYSNHVSYSLDNALKGKDRYYLSTSIKPGTDIWWPYCIVVAPKGKAVALTGYNGNTIQSLSAGSIPAAMGK